MNRRKEMVALLLGVGVYAAGTWILGHPEQWRLVRPRVLLVGARVCRTVSADIINLGVRLGDLGDSAQRAYYAAMRATQ